VLRTLRECNYRLASTARKVIDMEMSAGTSRRGFSGVIHGQRSLVFTYAADCKGCFFIPEDAPEKEPYFDIAQQAHERPDDHEQPDPHGGVRNSRCLFNLLGCHSSHLLAEQDLVAPGASSSSNQDGEIDPSQFYVRVAVMIRQLLVKGVVARSRPIFRRAVDATAPNL
jgi:hypothetical protein